MGDEKVDLVEPRLQEEERTIRVKNIRQSIQIKIV
jgi:hypothetical protein